MARALIVAILLFTALPGCVGALVLVVDCEAGGGALTRPTTDDMKGAGMQPLWEPCP